MFFAVCWVCCSWTGSVQNSWNLFNGLLDKLIHCLIVAAREEKSPSYRNTFALGLELVLLKVLGLSSEPAPPVLCQTIVIKESMVCSGFCTWFWRVGSPLGTKNSMVLLCMTCKPKWDRHILQVAVVSHGRHIFKLQWFHSTLVETTRTSNRTGSRIRANVLTLTHCWSELKKIII